jgi:hypothetical protein
MKYRLYIDEVGNSDLKSSRDPNHRYLSLTGVIFELDYVRETLHPQIEEMKRRFFKSHPDDPLIFHRKELVNKRYPFNALQDPEVEEAFNREILSLLRLWEYEVITVTIDKLEHLQRYEVWRYDPYHYCLKVLLERYIQYLKREESTGDVMAESRGGKEDMRLKKSFERVFEEGSDYVKSSEFQERLTSRQLKVEAKSKNIAGLQVADLIAHPSHKAALARKNNEKLPQNFGGEIAVILEELKYYRNIMNGRIDGWGRKWLP